MRGESIISGWTRQNRDWFPIIMIISGAVGEILKNMRCCIPISMKRCSMMDWWQKEKRISSHWRAPDIWVPSVMVHWFGLEIFLLPLRHWQNPSGRDLPCLWVVSPGGLRILVVSGVATSKVRSSGNWWCAGSSSAYSVLSPAFMACVWNQRGI